MSERRSLAAIMAPTFERLGLPAPDRAGGFEAVLADIKARAEAALAIEADPVQRALLMRERDAAVCTQLSLSHDLESL